jgi:hypothetical protein
MKNCLQFMLFHTLLWLVATSPVGLSAFAQDAGSNNADVKKIFIVYNTGEELQEFKAYTKLMARLKPFGRVDICINSPALKSSFEIPAGSCDWHEYASYNRSVASFFPDEKIASILPEDFVIKNRQLLLNKVSILRELGLSAALRSNEPRYLPEAFFEKYPHLRGPRVDHPRRSVQKEFAPCFHQPETADIYRNMVNQLYKNIPEIHSLYFSMNDAGSGFCWEDWLYSGPNGPSGCRNINKSECITTMLDIFKDGARQTGHDVDIYFKGMFTDEEMDDLVIRLPDNCFLEGRNAPPVKSIYTMSAYPVRGIINPLSILRILGRPSDITPERYVFTFWTSYSRGHERLETIEKVVEIVENHMKDPVGEGELNALQSLRKLCIRWGGEENAESLFNAFVGLDKAMNENRAALRGLDPLYWGVSTRHITRPLVFAPERLSPEEERYFLPHIFNVSVDEARNDYMDIHGGNRELPLNAVDNYLKDLKRIYVSIEKIQHAPEHQFLTDMARALHLYACVLRSCGNFNDAQIIRNRNKEKLAGPVHRPNKIPTWTGDQDFLDFMGIMRDELDNTLEMIYLLENGGMDLICHAKAPFPEDTFVLGADLIDQLKKKRKIMLEHWTDIEGYLTTPFK